MTIHLTPLAIIAGTMLVFSFIVATWKLFRFIFRVDRALPTLLNIANQFENNGGSTLKDSIDSIKDSLVSLVEKDEMLEKQDRIVLKIAEDSRLVADTNSKIVNELALAQTEDVRHIREYLHAKLHEINNTIGITNLQTHLASKQVQRIEERLDKMAPYIIRHRKDDTSEEIADSEDQRIEGDK